ncbi:MAG: septal ring lytic transglycosylase RlpA family protein [Hyphomicrobium aestuarii]|nr:septal ring lytic transglycosylase RlpA family protein [Hyphomicrobium aestuarii]
MTPPKRPRQRPPFTASTVVALVTAALVFAAVWATPAAAETGIASRYSEISRTASGRKVSPGDLVAAHRTLPFGTRVTVENLSNRRTVTVVIVDRGPFIRGRIIDLSPAAARALGFSGLARVRIRVAG